MAGGAVWPAQRHPTSNGGGTGEQRGPDYLTGEAVPMQSPMLTPIPPPARNGSMRHVEFLEDAVRAALAGNPDPGVLDTLLKQLEEANRVLNGLPTPTKDGSTGGHEMNGSPEYKTCDQSVLDAQAAKENQRVVNEDVSDLADKFIRGHKEFRLKVDSPIGDVMDLLDRVVKWFAPAIPAGPTMAEYLKHTLPLRPYEVSASVIHELRSGNVPTYVAVQQELDGLSVAHAPDGSGNKYLRHLSVCRQYVSQKVLKDLNLSTLNKAITRCLRASCDQNMLTSLGAVPNCVNFGVMLANVVGRDNKAILLEMHASLVAPIRMPQMGKGCTQPQEMLMYMLAAFDVRMNLAELLSANSASLAYLKLLESMPVGTGDMGPPVAEIKAIWEQNLMTDACTTREAVTASIKATLENLGGTRWNGELVQDQAHKRTAYSLDAEPASATAPPPKSVL
jgi:hypothetical protein